MTISHGRTSTTLFNKVLLPALFVCGVALDPAVSASGDFGEHIFGLSQRQLAAINEEMFPVTGRHLSAYVDKMDCSTDWRDLVLLQNSVLGAIQGPEYDAFLRTSFYNAFLATNKYKCFVNLYGIKFLYGIPSATHSLFEQKNIFKTLPGMSPERKKLSMGLHCQMVSNQDINVLIKPFLDILAGISANESSNFQEYIKAMMINKVKVHFPSNAGAQLANNSHTCLDELFIPIVTTYVVRKLETLPTLDDNSSVPSVNRIVRSLAMEEDVAGYQKAVGGMEIAELKKQMEIFVEDRQAKQEVLENLPMSTTRFIGGIIRRRPPCHPICRRLIGASRLFSHAKLVSCCTQCLGTTCKTDSRFKMLLPISKVDAPSKIYPYPVVSYTLDV